MLCFFILERDPVAILPTKIQFSMTQRGGRMLIYDGYRYVENRQSARNIFWRCSRYVKYSCRATVVTTKHPNEYPIRQSDIMHTHPVEKKKDDTVKMMEINV